jgi:hypothetical protein
MRKRRRMRKKERKIGYETYFPLVIGPKTWAPPCNTVPLVHSYANKQKIEFVKDYNIG